MTATGREVQGAKLFSFFRKRKQTTLLRVWATVRDLELRLVIVPTFAPSIDVPFFYPIFWGGTFRGHGVVLSSARTLRHEKHSGPAFKFWQSKLIGHHQIGPVGANSSTRNTGLFLWSLLLRSHPPSWGVGFFGDVGGKGRGRKILPSKGELRLCSILWKSIYWSAATPINLETRSLKERLPRLWEADRFLS